MRKSAKKINLVLTEKEIRQIDSAIMDAIDLREYSDPKYRNKTVKAKCDQWWKLIAKIETLLKSKGEL